jgi:hypothetical protein
LAGNPSSRRTVVSPETVLRFTASTRPVESTRTSPDTVSARLADLPVAAISPDTEFALRVPSRPRICTSPETAFTVRSPVSPSTMMSPETVLRRAPDARPDTRALADTTPSVSAMPRGTATLISAFGPPEPKLRNTSRKLSQRS